jgi:transcriptional regulator with XRE-family HTH domain
MNQEIATDEPILIELGERIKIARQAANLTQLELGDLIGRDSRTISSYEAGRVEIGILMFRKLCHYLKIPPSLFLEDL